MNHILLEVYCFKDVEKINQNDNPDFCATDKAVPGYHCLVNKCPYFAFTSHENALCYINNNSEAEEIISLGGEMVSDFCDESKAQLLWKEIAVEKINEAYEKYMDQKNHLTK